MGLGAPPFCILEQGVQCLCCSVDLYLVLSMEYYNVEAKMQLVGTVLEVLIYSKLSLVNLESLVEFLLKILLRDLFLRGALDGIL